MLEQIFTLISNIVKNHQLLTLLLGVLLIIASAADRLNIQSFSFNLNDPFGRLGLAAIGTLLVFSSLDLLPTRKVNAKGSDKSTYGVKIVGDNFELPSFKMAPGEGFNAAEIRVSGVIEAEIPSDKSIWLFHVYYGSKILYFPQRQVVVSNDKKTWNGIALVGKIHSKNSKIIVAVVGDSGKILCDYYWSVKDETSKYIGLSRLPIDIIECDSRDIRVR